MCRLFLQKYFELTGRNEIINRCPFSINVCEESLLEWWCGASKVVVPNFFTNVGVRLASGGGSGPLLTGTPFTPLPAPV